MGDQVTNRLTGWLADELRDRRAFRLDKSTGRVVERRDDFRGRIAGLARRSFGRHLAAYKTEEPGTGSVIVIQHGRRRLVLDGPAGAYQASVTGRLLRRLTVRRDGHRLFSATGVYFWLALGPFIDGTWDGLDEMAEDYPQTLAEIVSQPANRQNVIDRWAGDYSAGNSAG